MPVDPAAPPVIGPDRSEALAELAALDDAAGVAFSDLGFLVGTVTGPAAQNRAATDYATALVRAGADWTLSYNPGHLFANYVWTADGEAQIRLSNFSHYNVIGSDGRDLIITGDGNDYIDTGAGDDSIRAGAGRDFIWAGDGDDLIATASNRSQIDGGAGIDTLTLDLSGFDAGVTVQTGATAGQWQQIEILKGSLTQGDDTVIADGHGLHGLSGFAGRDTLIVDYVGLAVRADPGWTLAFAPLAAGRDFYWDGTTEQDLGFESFEIYQVTGSAGRDLIETGDFDDLIHGGAGNDDLRGGAGTDTVWGDDGDDAITVVDTLDQVYGGAGTDTLALSLAAVTGGINLVARSATGRWQGIEAFTGTLTAGDDRVDVRGPQTAALNGGAGTDYLLADYRTAAVRPGTALTLSFTPGDGTADHLWTGTAQVALNIQNFERYSIRGSEGHDRIALQDANDIVRAGAGDDSIAGNGGNDYLDGGTGTNVIWGGDGNDRLFNAGDGSRLYGGAGNDILIDTGHAALLEGGTGDDIYRVAGQVAIVEGADGGNDTVQSQGDFVLPDGVETLVMMINHANTGTGNAADNTMIGQRDADILSGLDGNDTLSGRAGNDQLFGGTGDDRLIGSTGADLLEGGAGDDKLYGGAVSDTLLGENGNDLLVGDLGNDHLFGGADTDTLIGGAGRDMLEGGAGSDIFLFRDDFGHDVITDFEDRAQGAEGYDRLDRINLAQMRPANGGQVVAFDQIILRQNGTQAIVELDFDRDGVADLRDYDGDGDRETVSITLVGVDVATVGAEDFIL